jgi:hypothetical protein
MNEEIPSDMGNAADALRNLLAAHRRAHVPVCDGSCLCGWCPTGTEQWDAHRRGAVLASVAGTH